MNHRFESRETSVIGAVGCIFVQNITKEGFQYKPLLFFLFCVLEFINFLVIFGGIHEYFARKLENLGWFSWNAKNQKIFKPIWCLDWALWRQLRLALCSSPRFDPRAQSRHHMGFNFFWFSHFIKPPKVPSFHAKIFVIPPKIPKNEWNQ